jgi:glycosyltransferase involved in cell wall biosynthesis
MKLSVIFVSNSYNKELQMMTQNAINTACTGEINKEIIIIESSGEKFENADKIIYEKNSFNYNKFLNIGIRESSGNYLALCNNDLIFLKNWDQIVKIMQDNNILSASPFSENKCGHKSKYKRDSGIYYGYRIGHELLGWCVVISKQVFTIIGSLDESKRFWYSDNLYAKQLIKNKIKHALITNCIVQHLCSKTLSLLDKDKQFEYTMKEK